LAERGVKKDTAAEFDYGSHQHFFSRASGG